ncbi:hypothetical protein [Xanthomonas arboricola]|uniref:hypothetical protein n=1 Tax=Xanthomonas arboricola TaxID=56448 RepID=UPI00143058E0|nr:hypothetical protein [Xanthomonas arboricola]NJB80287.1 hypothetical protein [Xanthomonas arboricola]
MVNQLAQFSPLDAATYVQQQGEMGRQRGQQNKLAQLASQSYSTPADQQGQLLGQMAAIDPKAAQTQQTQFESAEDRRNKTLANMSNLLVNAPEQARPGLYQQMLPTLKQFGVDAPAAYDATTAPVIDQTAQALYKAYSGSGTSGAVQSTYVDDQGQRVAILRDGSTRVLGGNDAGASQQTLTIDINGEPTQVTFDRRTGRYKNAFLPTSQQGAAPASGSVFMGADGVPVDISQVTDPAVRQSIMAQSAGWGAVPDGGAVAMPAQAGGRPLVGRTKEAETAAVEAARQAAQLQYLPQELGMRSQDAVQRAGATTAVEASAKQRAEQEGQRTERTRDARDTLSLLERAEQILPSATGSRGGQLVDAAAGLVGTSTPGAQATAQLQTIAGQLTSKMPRMQGPQSDRDVQLYQQMAGDLANPSIPTETRLAALRTIRALNQKYANQQPAASGNRAPANSGSSYSDLWK